MFAQAPTFGTCTVLPADNIWNTPVDTMPVSASSSTYISTIGPAAPLKADFGSGTWNGGPIGIPFLKLPGSQPKYTATFLYWDESDAGPYAIPLNAPIEGGSNSSGDRHAIAVDVDNCILYELYRAFPQATNWKADSGAIYNLRSNALRPSTWTSADAAGLAIVPGLVRYDEVAAGEIRHAIRFTVPQTLRAFIWPARHYASSLTDPRYPPMGQRFRLKAGFDISPFPADVQVILRALKKYGMILADNGSPWYLSGEPDSRWNNDNLGRMRNISGSAFEAVDVSSLMIDPNSGQAKQSGPSVSVTPSSATVTTLATRQFTAAVQNSPGQSVTWSVNGIAGGNSQFGYVDASGLYSAPSVIPSPATVTVQAAITASPAIVGSASVTIQYPAPVISSVTPSPVTVGNYTLTVNGSAFQSGAVVRWNGTALATTFVSASKLTATGTASTPASTVPITVVNPGGQVSNTLNITVAGTTPISVTVSPTSANVRIRQTRQFTANVPVTWKVNGITGGNSTVGRINTNGLYTAPNQVPSPSTVSIRATSTADSTKSATASVNVSRR
jgi:hypothetical protein